MITESCQLVCIKQLISDTTEAENSVRSSLHKKRPWRDESSELDLGKATSGRQNRSFEAVFLADR
jgi:hypothetical protein